ncbi:MAG: nodulation protein NfeD [archaeon GB-1867-005]|nr:nodulation protein NfeD [Candidatus Culexmicrobium cathedralense]
MRRNVMLSSNRFSVLIAIALLILTFSLTVYGLASAANAKRVYLAELEMTIDRGAYEFLSDALAKAERDGAPLILRLNTYGGYMESMDLIIDLILNAKVTVVAWIGPRGAKATSAGTFIAMAAQRIVMADGTVIGSCQPRSIDPAQPVDPKVLNYAIAKMRALAERRYGVNDSRVDIAVKFVTENLDLTAREAYSLKMIDFLADSVEEILDELGLTGAEVITLSPGITSQIYSFLNDPLIIGLFFELGFWLILIDLFTAGIQVYGFVGAALIVLALFGMGILGVSATIIALMIVGAALVFVELKYPGIQIFGFAGLAMWIISIILMYREQPYIEVTIPQYAIIASLAVGGGFLLFYLHRLRQAMRLRKRMFDPKKLIGMVGTAKTDIKPGKYGVVHAASDNWTAFSDYEIKAGEKVKIIEVVGLKIKVVPLKKEASSNAAS